MRKNLLNNEVGISSKMKRKKYKKTTLSLITRIGAYEKYFPFLKIDFMVISIFLLSEFNKK